MAKLHLLRTAAGIRDIDHLRQVQEQYRVPFEGRNVDVVTTRNRPTRAAEILSSGGSLYWIVKRKISVRQKILDIYDDKDEEGRRYCVIFLDTELVMTEPYNKKPIQGWRYLKPEDAPRDLTKIQGEGDAMPPEMVRELRRLGLL